MKLGEILLRRKLLAESQLEDTLIRQLFEPKQLGVLLLEEKIISDRALADALREQYWRRHGYWILK